jgi:DNA-binding transcriptional MerR regulator
MEGILKLLRKLGYSEDEIKTVLNKVPVNQEGLTGTNVATGIFSKPKKGELAKDFLVSDTIGNPFEVNYFKGRSEKDILISAEAQLKMIDDELTKLTDQLLNKNLQLSEAQQINFAKNLETRKRFKKDFEAFKTKPEAEVLNIKTGETVTDLKKLIDEQGTKNPPTTVAGQLETTGKRLEQKGKELEEVTKPKSVIGDIMRDYSDFNKYMQSSQKTGYVRATVRQIMREDIQAGKLKLSKELQDQVMQGTGEPIDVYRKVYGEGALEQIDNLADDLGQFRTEEEAAKFARSKYTIEPKTKPVDESISYEEL